MTPASQRPRPPRQSPLPPAPAPKPEIKSLSGQGVLIPVFALAGFFGGPFLARMVLGMVEMDGEAATARWMMAFMAGGGALALWFFVRLFGNEEASVKLDRYTGQHHRVRTRHACLYFTPVVWAWAATAFTVMAAFIGYNAPVDPYAVPSGRASAKGTAAFKTADALLDVASSGLFHGNSPQAKEFAEVFSNALKEIRSEGIERQKSSSRYSATKGNFLTYCHLTERGCIFMVHVPDLRNFANDAKDFIADAAWAVAVRIVGSSGRTPERVVVGVRGAMFYDRVVVSSAVPSERDKFLTDRTVRGQTDSHVELAVQFDFANQPVRPAAAQAPRSAEPQQARPADGAASPPGSAAAPAEIPEAPPSPAVAPGPDAAAPGLKK